MRLALPLGADGSDGFCPSTRTLGIVGASSAQAQLRLKFAIRATSASIRATSAAIKGVFLGQIRRRCSPRLTHIRDVAATKKIQSQTPAHLHTLKRGVSNCKVLLALGTIIYSFPTHWLGFSHHRRLIRIGL